MTGKQQVLSFWDTVPENAPVSNCPVNTGDQIIIPEGDHIGETMEVFNIEPYGASPAGWILSGRLRKPDGQLELTVIRTLLTHSIT